MHRLTFDLLLHIAGVGGMGGSPSIILVVTVTGWGVDLSFTNIFHQQLITFIGTFFVADVFINLDPSISFDDVFFSCRLHRIQNVRQFHLWASRARILRKGWVFVETKSASKKSKTRIQLIAGRTGKTLHNFLEPKNMFKKKCIYIIYIHMYIYIIYIYVYIIYICIYIYLYQVVLQSWKQNHFFLPFQSCLCSTTRLIFGKKTRLLGAAEGLGSFPPLCL